MIKTLEDFTSGQVITLGQYALSEEDVVDFARRFDPQPFHMQPEAARTQAVGGLMASGWHTTGIFMRLAVEAYLSSTAVLTSPGVDKLRWLRPVRPKDVLSGQVTVIETRVSQTKPDRGVLIADVDLRNQHNETVMTMVTTAFVLTRSGLAAIQQRSD